MNSNRLSKYALIFVVSVVVCFMFISITKSVPALHGDSDWIGFYGTLMAATMGGAITFLGVKLTIERTEDLRKEDVKLSTRPFFSTKALSVKFVPHDALIKLKSDYGYDNNVKYSVLNHIGCYELTIELSNIGAGHSLNSAVYALLDFEGDAFDQTALFASKIIQINDQAIEGLKKQGNIALNENARKVVKEILLKIKTSTIRVNDSVMFKFLVPIKKDSAAINFSLTVLFDDLYQNNYAQSSVITIDPLDPTIVNLENVLNIDCKVSEIKDNNREKRGIKHD